MDVEMVNDSYILLEQHTDWLFYLWEYFIYFSYTSFWFSTFEFIA